MAVRADENPGTTPQVMRMEGRGQRITRRAWPLVAILGCSAPLLVVAGCGPRTYQEAMKAAGEALVRGDDTKAEKYYTIAFEKADEVGNGSRAMWAADFAADLATRHGKPEKAESLYRHLIATYPRDVASMAQRFKFANNLAVLCSRQGKHREAQALLEEATAAWKGKSYSPALPYGLHMLLLRNLAKGYQAQGWGPSAESTYRGVVEIVKWKEQSRSYGVGTAQVLSEFAILLRAAQRPDEAAELEARARTIENDEKWRNAAADFTSCQQREVEGRQFTSCYLEIP